LVMTVSECKEMVGSALIISIRNIQSKSSTM
jgi:hypothetical protein